MKLTKSIIAEMVSYIDFADIREFVKNYPELVEAEETIKNFIFDSLLISINIRKINKFDFIQF